LFSTCSGLDQLPDDQLPLKEIAVTEIYISGGNTSQTWVDIVFSGVIASSPSYYYDFACTESLSVASLMTIPNHTVTPENTTGVISPALDPAVDTTAYFDTATIIYIRDEHVGIGPKLISKYHIVTPSMVITFE
jgi:hypothetical protein